MNNTKILRKKIVSFTIILIIVCKNLYYKNKSSFNFEAKL